MKRRNALALIGVGVAGTSGCLRLQDEGNSTPQESPPTDGSSSAGTPSDDGSSEVTLTESWTDENGVNQIWTHEDVFYYNDYNYAAEASEGSGVRWSADTTYNGFERNFGVDAFAADGQYAIFGYAPEVEDDEEIGAHFHAYRRYDGEEVWVVGAPSDGTHKLASGVTVVDDIAVLAVSDYGDGNTGEPLVYGVDITTGEVRWRTDQSVLPASLIRDVVSHDGNVYVATTDGIKILASDTGELIGSQDQWYVGTSGFRLESLGQIHGETLFAGWGNKFFNAYPLGENGLSWSRSDFGRVSTKPAVDNSLVAVGTQAGDVYAFERDSGETRWEASITNSVGAIETTGSHIWVGDTDIGLTAYDRETGSLVHRSTKPVNGDDIAVLNSDLLLLGGDTATAYEIN
jgi:outer membrane protein assembly factor BamB